ncbi:MAG: type II toxin-antitoxin system RelE/ParE family toxin [Verrucomicrobia bacterium]|nr:type II toxin-antitoxin system RelE/ParE family toxin [Verrucomicrobiota bacterium]
MVLDPAAKAELREAASYYERCRDDLGGEFLDAIELAFAQIRRHPTLWRLVKGRFRRYLVHRFPYAVIYAVEGDTLFVAAIMHNKRKPDYWIERIATK